METPSGKNDRQEQPWDLRYMDCLLLEVPTDTRLIYMDPPFGPVGEDTYFGVGENFHAYLSYMHARITHLTRGLKNYNFVLHVNWRSSHYPKCMVDGIVGREKFQNEIVWAYSSPSVAKRHLPRKHDVLLWWGVGDYPFNPLRVPYKEGFSVGASLRGPGMSWTGSSTRSAGS